MAQRRRPIRLTFYVSEEEQEKIEENIDRSKAGNLSNYLRQMALNGTVTQIDVSAIQDLHKELGNLNRNLHQIVYRAALTAQGTGGSGLHEQDYRDIVADYTEIRRRIDQMLTRQMHAVARAGRLREKKRGHH